MKKLTRIIFTSFFSIIFLFSCTKQFVKINTNPATYDQENFNPNYLLTNAELSYAGQSSVIMRTGMIYCAPLIQGFATTSNYTMGDKYTYLEDYIAAYWNDAYPKHIKYLTDIVARVQDKSEFNNLLQISRILRAAAFQRMTDFYGDVPYSEAGLGYYQGILNPKYDKQEFIYLDMMEEVEDAVAKLNPSGDLVPGDIIYNGNVEKWARFGNSLILRMAMRLTKIDINTSQTWVQKVVGKTMNSNDDNALVLGDLAGGTNTYNIWSYLLTAGQDTYYYYYKWSKTFIDQLKKDNDPRLGKLAISRIYLSPQQKTQNPNYVSDPSVQKGMPNGKDLSHVPGIGIETDPSYTDYPDYSSPSLGMLKLDGPLFILTYGETELLLAEAAERFGIGGNPEVHYKNGVRAAMTFLKQYDPSMEITDGEVDTYLAENPYDPSNPFEMINTQYWLHTISMFDFFECWFNWRRSGFPNLIPVQYPGNVTNGTIPRRFPYPLIENSLNPENYQVASSSVIGGDSFVGRVWWDKE